MRTRSRSLCLVSQGQVGFLLAVYASVSVAVRPRYLEAWLARNTRVRKRVCVCVKLSLISFFNLLFFFVFGCSFNLQGGTFVSSIASNYANTVDGFMTLHASKSF